MVSCSSLNTDSRPPKLRYTLSLITFYFFLVIPYATLPTFNLANIGTDHINRDIKVEKNTHILDQGIQVTPDERGTDRSQRAWRATYIRALHLWDNATGKLANFSTSFTFVIDSGRIIRTQMGLLSFWLQITAGGTIGLPVDPVTIQATNQFVAVEFDTFWNKDWIQLIALQILRWAIMQVSTSNLLHPDSKLRSSIRQAILILNCEDPVPILPPKMPVATYFAPPTYSFSVACSADGHENNQTHSSSYGYTM